MTFHGTVTKPRNITVSAYPLFSKAIELHSLIKKAL